MPSGLVVEPLVERIDAVHSVHRPADCDARRLVERDVCEAEQRRVRSRQLLTGEQLPAASETRRVGELPEPGLRVIVVLRVVRAARTVGLILSEDQQRISNGVVNHRGVGQLRPEREAIAVVGDRHPAEAVEQEQPRRLGCAAERAALIGADRSVGRRKRHQSA